MQAIAIETESGGSTRLELRERPTPRPGPGEALIAVRAAGVNRADLVQRAGLYPPPPGAPDIMGLEAAGYIEAVGEGVREWRPGQRVVALLAGGGYATHVAVDARCLLELPDTMSFDEAAALCEAVYTVWANVFEAGRLRFGERFLMQGGTSGIGVVGVQMAKAFGAEVFATAGSDSKAAFLRELGADRAIQYQSEDFAGVLKEAGGADVILDMVGGAYVQRHLAALRPGGRLVHIAFMEGSRVEVDLMAVMLKRLTITGSTLRSRAPEEKARLTGEIARKVWPLCADGTIRAVIDSRYPLAEAEAAQARMQAGGHIGKILLTVAG